MTVVLGILYPLLVTVLAQVIFPAKANGSLIRENNKILGSELIGQCFDTAIYFWSRPSAVQYNPLPSGASNYGLTSKTLITQVNERNNHFLAENLLANNEQVPSEMVFASASGLDPDISPEAAFLQVDRICRARHWEEKYKFQIIGMIRKLTQKTQFFILGEARINVLLLNLELDKIR